MIMNMPLQQQEMRKGLWAHLQDPRADLTAFPGPAHMVSTPAGNQKADALAKIGTLITDPSVDTADRLHWKSECHATQVGWHIANEEVLGLNLRVVALASANLSSSTHQSPQQQGMGKMTTQVCPLLLSKGSQYALLCVDTTSGLTQACPSWRAKHTAWPLVRGLKILSTLQDEVKVGIQL